MASTHNKQRVYLVRHGETEWSLSGRHTGSTDIALTGQGRRAAERLAPVLQRESFDLVLVSPLKRARETCALAGFSACASTDVDLREWNYGAFEGKTPQEIQALAPDWLLFRDGCPGGDSPDQVWDRLDHVIARVRATPGNVALFAHGHILRALGARWIGLAVADGCRFRLDPATLCVLSYYHGIPAIERWNDALDS
jgi:broad specificity phosphatase PhoE